MAFDSLGILLEAAVDVADKLQLPLHGEVELLEHLAFPPDWGRPRFRIKDMLEHSRFESFDPMVVYPHPRDVQC